MPSNCLSDRMEVMSLSIKFPIPRITNNKKGVEHCFNSLFYEFYNSNLRFMPGTSPWVLIAISVNTAIKAIINSRA